MQRPTMTYYAVRWFDVIRVSCQHDGCKAVIELPLRTVETVMKRTNGCCPVCGKPFTKPTVEGGADIVTQLAKVVLALNELAPQLGIEFPVSENPDPPKTMLVR